MKNNIRQHSKTYSKGVGLDSFTVHLLALKGVLTFRGKLNPVLTMDATVQTVIGILTLFKK